MEGRQLFTWVAVTAVAVLGLGMLLLFGGGPPPAPPLPKPPPAPEAFMNAELKYSPSIYRGLIESDARTFDVPLPTMDELRAPNPYYEVLRGSRRLRVRETLDTPHLRLTLEVSKRKASIEGQSFATEHLILRIQNRTDRYLAYRLPTALADPSKCATKGEIKHDALVLAPGQVVERAECLYRGQPGVELKGLEIIELPPLEAHYVSRLQAGAVLTDPRIASAHVPLKGKLCPQTFSWRDIREGVERKEFGWRDIVDFYARHNCEEYSFFRSYRYRTDPSGPLPARSLD